MKKILSVLLCVVMSASMLSGCKKDSVSDTKPAPAPAVPAFEEVRDYLIDNTKNNDGMYSKLIDIDSDTYDFMLSYDEDEEGNPSLENILDDDEFEIAFDRFDELQDEEEFENM